MAGEILVAYGITAKTLYAIVRNTIAQVAQSTSSTFVTYVTANLANYTVALVEQGTASGVYVGTFPTWITAGTYNVTAYVRAGGSAAEGDAVAGTGEIQWTGSAVLALSAAAAAVWDEVLTGATHNITNSAGKRLRTLPTSSMRDGTAQGATNNTITLDSGASAVDGIYDPGIVVILNGTGAGQARMILDYVGSTKVATIDRDWRINPDATSEFTISGVSASGHVHEGRAGGATSTTITLGVGAQTTDDIYNGQVVFIKSGVGQDQVRIVTDYVGSTKVATVSPAWVTTPNTTSAYIMAAFTLPANFAAMLVSTSGGVTVGDITTPTETAGRPSTMLGMLRRLFEWRANKRTRSRSSGDVVVFGADNSTPLETQNQSTAGTDDTQTKGA